MGLPPSQGLRNQEALGGRASKTRDILTLISKPLDVLRFEKAGPLETLITNPEAGTSS